MSSRGAKRPESRRISDAALAEAVLRRRRPATWVVEMILSVSVAFLLLVLLVVLGTLLFGEFLLGAIPNLPLVSTGLSGAREDAGLAGLHLGLLLVVILTFLQVRVIIREQRLLLRLHDALAQKGRLPADTTPLAGPIWRTLIRKPWRCPVLMARETAGLYGSDEKFVRQVRRQSQPVVIGRLVLGSLVLTAAGLAGLVFFRLLWLRYRWDPVLDGELLAVSLSALTGFLNTTAGLAPVWLLLWSGLELERARVVGLVRKYYDALVAKPTD